MPEESQLPIGGSVIERSFVATDIAAIVFAATAPVAEIAPFTDHDEPDFLRNTLAALLGVPGRTVIGEKEYTNLARVFIQALSSSRGRVFPRFWDYTWRSRIDELESMMSELRDAEARPIRPFAEHALALFASTGRPGHSSSQWFLMPPGNVIQDLFDVDLDEDAAHCGIACVAARLYRERKVERFTDSLLRYELPLGQSPATTSDSLLKLLESGKKMCLAPLAAGGAIGVGQLGQAQYVAALLRVATGSAMTLILLGSIAVGSLLVARVAQQRNDGTARGRSNRRR